MCHKLLSDNELIINALMIMLWGVFKSPLMYFIHLCLTNKNIYSTEVCRQFAPMSIKLLLGGMMTVRGLKYQVLLVGKWKETGKLIVCRVRGG